MKFSVNGTVTDQGGNAVSGANVALKQGSSVIGTALTRPVVGGLDDVAADMAQQAEVEEVNVSMTVEAKPESKARARRRSKRKSEKRRRQRW